MKRHFIAAMTALTALTAIIFPVLITGCRPDTTVSLGGNIPEMKDENRNTELATFALG